MPYWPASPETVAEHLKHRAERRSLSTVYTIRNAIAKTHSSGGFGERFHKGVVAATLQELASAKGEVRDRRKNISGGSLSAAELNSIREAALEPRQYSRGMESHKNAARRGPLDLALCSLVLEAGIGCEQVAALEWQDLTVDANGGPAIRIRSGSAGAADVVPISVRVWEDLSTIAPNSAAASKWIFGLTAMQISVRVLAVARVPGLESRIVETGSRRAARGETAGASDVAARIRGSYWRAFCIWCDVRGAATLPACAETVAEYLKDGSESKALESINQRRRAISEVHVKAGHVDPCATPLVEATIREIGRTGPDFSPQSLTASALDSIRAAAMLPRRYRARHESEAAARKRGLVDIALCSIVHAGRLSVLQAVSLKWKDVEKLGEGRARLNVKARTNFFQGPEVREITAQAVRDLEAIRGDARPEDSVIGLTRHAAYRRMRDAARIAGYVKSGMPSTTGPAQPATTEPSHVEPAGPSQTLTEGPPTPR